MMDGYSIASRRILRLALGTALAIGVSQGVDWPISFITPIITGLLLSLPLPPPSPKLAFKFLVFLAGTMFCSFLLLPYLYYAPTAGIILVALALFGSFLITEMGGTALIGTVMTIALTLLTTVGSVSIDMLVNLTKGLTWSAFAGFVFVWVSHALLPDGPVQSSPADGKAEKPMPSEPDSKTAIRSAFRALVIVFPVMLVFLFLSTSSAYTIIMIKIATMGQQATTCKSRALGSELMASTFWGGLGAFIAWLAIKAYPSLFLYIFIIALAALLYGRGIFREGGMHPKAAMWQYAFITLIIVLAPTVGSMATGQSASDKFLLRLVYFIIITGYSWLAVTVFDGFWKSRPARALEA